MRELKGRKGQVKMRKMKSFIGVTIAALMIFTSCAKTNEQVKNVDAKKNEVAVKAEEALPEDDFSVVRAKFETNLIKKGPAPQGYREQTPPEGVSEVTYKSGELELKGWLSKPEEDGKKYPAVVYVHGGFAFGKADWDFVEQYLENGFMVFTPTFRGENGNPGNFEFFYGEVDDVIAAGEYLAGLSYIDKENIFVSGHSTGGTLAMLTSMMPSPFKAAASFGGSPDQKAFFKHWEEKAPFDVNVPEEIELRSPMEFIDSLKIPLTLYVGKNDIGYKYRSKKFAETAQEQGKACKFVEIEGNHFTSLEESIGESVKEFKEK